MMPLRHAAAPRCYARCLLRCRCRYFRFAERCRFRAATHADATMPVVTRHARRLRHCRYATDIAHADDAADAARDAMMPRLWPLILTRPR